MRVMWKGAVSFGLVTIPIHLYAATESKNVSLRQVHEADGGRIQYKRVCTVDGEEVPYADIAKGYELSDGGMVVLTDKELSELPISTSRSIDVQEFVPLEAIDPIYFDKSYYLEPQKAAIKPYVLLRDALHKSGQVAITKVAIRQRESLAVLRVVSDVMVLTTMLWPDEVREVDFPFLREDAPEVRSQEMSMASSLIDSLSDSVFEPDKYRDSYREALLNLIQSKIDGKETEHPPETASEPEVTDLMSALQASVTAAKEARGAGSDGDAASADGGAASTTSSEQSDDSRADDGEAGDAGESSDENAGSTSSGRTARARSAGSKADGGKGRGSKSAETKTTSARSSGSGSTSAKSSNEKSSGAKKSGAKGSATTSASKTSGSKTSETKSSGSKTSGSKPSESESSGGRPSSGSGAGHKATASDGQTSGTEKAPRGGSSRSARKSV
ncbi:DNA end-binding protein Ku [Prauserella sediminis]|uniref:Non-homologous end joining protein Ku n=1 Tax=Prauserella sediminis TaxID=577680 RepID=A0A839XNG4_9PSEU|nr:DNA end-binding protein Ku [Prauserella sediminis]